MDKIFSFFEGVFEKEYSNIEDIINDLESIGLKCSNECYNKFWTINEIKSFSNNKKGLFMNATCCGTWGGWLHHGKFPQGLILLESEEELKIKYLEHIINEHKNIIITNKHL